MLAPHTKEKEIEGKCKEDFGQNICSYKGKSFKEGEIKVKKNYAIRNPQHILR